MMDQRKKVDDSASSIDDDDRVALLDREIERLKSENALLQRSERRFRALLSGLPDIVMRFDRDGRHLFISENMDELTDIPVSEFIGRSHQELGFSEKQCRFWRASFKEVIEAGSAQEREFSFEGKQEKRVFSLRFAAELDANGQVQSILVIARDITLQRDTEQNYTTLFTEMLNGFALHEIILDERGASPDYRFLAVNPAFERLTGLRGRDIVGRTVKQVLPEIEPEWIETYVKVVLTGKPAFFVNYAEALDKYFEVTAFRTAEKRFATIFSDVSERKRLEKRLRQAERMEAIGQLAGGIAHDFNNILGAIIGYTDISLDHVEKNSEVEDNLRQVLKAAHRAKVLVKQILTFSRQGDQEKQVVYLAPIAAESLRFLKESIPSTVLINVDIKEDTEGVYVDPSMIHEVFLNLSANAVQAMRQKGTLTIRLYEVHLAEREYGRMGEIEPGDYSVIEVEDTGAGMDERVLEHVFDPFFTTKEPGEGTGMGLAVVFGIVQSHSGNLQVESVLNRGTIFRVFLPKSKEESGGQRDGRGGHPQRGKERILFVDDEEMLVEMVTGLLTPLGYTVKGVTSAIEALKIIEERSWVFDVLVTDQTMPHMTGAELAKKTLKVLPELPIVLCSGYSSGINPDRVRAIGIKSYLVKPLTRRDLTRAIRDVLDH